MLYIGLTVKIQISHLYVTNVWADSFTLTYESGSPLDPHCFFPVVSFTFSRIVVITHSQREAYIWFSQVKAPAPAADDNYLRIRKQSKNYYIVNKAGLFHILFGWIKF